MPGRLFSFNEIVPSTLWTLLDLHVATAKWNHRSSTFQHSTFQLFFWYRYSCQHPGLIKIVPKTKSTGPKPAEKPNPPLEHMTYHTIYGIRNDLLHQYNSSHHSRNWAPPKKRNETYKYMTSKSSSTDLKHPEVSGNWAQANKKSMHDMHGKNSSSTTAEDVAMGGGMGRGRCVSFQRGAHFLPEALLLRTVAKTQSHSIRRGAEGELFS